MRIHRLPAGKAARAILAVRSGTTQAEKGFSDMKASQKRSWILHRTSIRRTLSGIQREALSLLREIESFCDAVAAITLKEIGDDPACYRRALERMTYVGSTVGNTTRSETRTHPSLEARVKLNKWLCQRL